MAELAGVAAAAHFLSIVWDDDAPGDQLLLAALDRLVSAYHDAPEAGPADTDVEPPREDGAALYRQVADRFPAYGLYPVSDPTALPDDASAMGDAVDDITDLTLDMREVVWRAENFGPDDAHWFFRLFYFHWGRHARELALYLHSRQFG